MVMVHILASIDLRVWLALEWQVGRRLSCKELVTTEILLRPAHLTIIQCSKA
jgi:hypothetical protein